MPTWQPNARFDHIYAIVRLDKFPGMEFPGEDAITITKAFWASEEAEAEVGRLNQLTAKTGARYFWRVARLQRPP